MQSKTAMMRFLTGSICGLASKASALSRCVIENGGLLIAFPFLCGLFLISSGNDSNQNDFNAKTHTVLRCAGASYVQYHRYERRWHNFKGKKNSSLSFRFIFYARNDRFTKTGSEQT
jgi:hypothetical protein